MNNDEIVIVLSELIEKINNLERIMISQGIIRKEILDFEEACNYTKISKSKLYKLTAKRKIEFYKPDGKKIYFLRLTLDKWMLKKKYRTYDDIRDEV